MRTIAIENLKGGVGKTVTTISLAHILVEDYRKRVLVVDCDGQCNLTRFYLGQVPDAPTLAEVLTGAHEPYWQDNVLSVRPGLWLLPASQELYRLDLAAIRRTDKVPESTFLKQPVLDYSAASRDYRLLCQEIFGEVADDGKV